MFLKGYLQTVSHIVQILNDKLNWMISPVWVLYCGNESANQSIFIFIISLNQRCYSLCPFFIMLSAIFFFLLQESAGCIKPAQLHTHTHTPLRHSKALVSCFSYIHMHRVNLFIGPAQQHVNDNAFLKQSLKLPAGNICMQTNDLILTSTLRW